MPTYRKLLPTEHRVYTDLLLSLDDRDRYSRFTGTVSDATIIRRCESLDWSRVSLLGAWESGRLVGAAEVCTDRAFWPGEAELALSIASDVQGRGLGGQLTRRALTIARNRGIRTVHMICLADNRRMRALARRFDGTMEMECGEVTVSFPVPRPNQFSLTLEALDEGTGMVASLFDSLRDVRFPSFVNQAGLRPTLSGQAGDLERAA